MASGSIVEFDTVFHENSSKSSGFPQVICWNYCHVFSCKIIFIWLQQIVRPLLQLTCLICYLLSHLPPSHFCLLKRRKSLARGIFTSGGGGKEGNGWCETVEASTSELNNTLLYSRGWFSCSHMCAHCIVLPFSLLALFLYAGWILKLTTFLLSRHFRAEFLSFPIRWLLTRKSCSDWVWRKTTMLMFPIQ